MPQSVHVKQTPHRSRSAVRAHGSGKVTRTIDLATSPGITVSERANLFAARKAWSLAALAVTVWVYDVARVAVS